MFSRSLGGRPLVFGFLGSLVSPGSRTHRIFGSKRPHQVTTTTHPTTTPENSKDEVPQGWTRCHHHPGPPCRKEVRDHPAARQWHQGAPLPSRTRRRYRALSSQGHPPYGKDQAAEEVQGQAFRQAGQLHAHHAHSLHARAREPQGRSLQRHIQGGFPKGGC